MFLNIVYDCIEPKQSKLSKISKENKQLKKGYLDSGSKICICLKSV